MQKKNINTVKLGIFKRSISDVNSLEIIKKHIHKYIVITTQRKSKAFPKVDSKNKQLKHFKNIFL